MTARAWRCNRCGWLCPPDAKACASCDKGKPRKRKRPPPSFRPWRCVVLAVDGGARSGWSIWSLGKLAMSGEFNVYTDVGLRETIRVVEQAKSYAAQLGVPWVALIEESWGGRMGVGMGAAGGWWKFAMRNAQLPLSRIGTVLPNVWRARALPKGSNGLSRDAVRAVELRVARAMVSGDGDDVALLGSDEAPALLIGKWGTQAGEIGAMLPKNARVTV